MSKFLTLMGKMGQTGIKHSATTMVGKVTTTLHGGNPVALTRKAVLTGIAEGRIVGETTITAEAEDGTDDTYSSGKLMFAGKGGSRFLAEALDTDPVPESIAKKGKEAKAEAPAEPAPTV